MNGYLYKVTHIPTGYLYFGSRKTPEGIAPDADSYMGSPKGSNMMLELFNTKPSEEFTKEILTVLPYDEVGELENLLIKEAWEKFGKVHEGGLVCNLHAGQAIIMTDEIRAKVGQANKTRVFTKEIRANMSAAMKGRKMPPFSDAHRAKLSAARLGTKASAATRAQMSADRKGKKMPPRSDAHKANLSAARKGQPSKSKKSVVNTETGLSWDSVTSAAQYAGVTVGRMSTIISKGKRGGIWRFA